MTAKYNTVKLDSVTTIRKWLKERYPAVEPKRAGQLAQALGVNATEIIAEDNA